MVKIWELQTGEEITVEPEAGKTKERAEGEKLFYHVLFYMFMELCISS